VLSNVPISVLFLGIIVLFYAGFTPLNITLSTARRSLLLFVPLFVLFTKGTLGRLPRLTALLIRLLALLLLICHF
jgi:hypothetical protein